MRLTYRLQGLGMLGALTVGALAMAWLVTDTRQAVAGLRAPPPTQQSAARLVPELPAVIPGVRISAAAPAQGARQARPSPAARSDELDAVRAALRDARLSVRLQALDDIEARASLAAALALTDAFSDPQPRMRRLAAAAIASMPGQSQPALAQRALADADPTVRQIAVEALTVNGNAATLDVFSRALHDHDAQVRASAVDQLALSAAPRARDLLQLALADPDAVVAATAVAAGRLAGE